MNRKTENSDTFSDFPVESLKHDALAMVGKCIECGSCYVDCAFNNYGNDSDQCQQWIRESNDFLQGKIKKLSKELIEANFKCAECNRCYQSCPEGIYRRHGNMMMKHMVGNPLRLRLNIHPYSNLAVKQPAIEQFIVSKWKQEERDWYASLNNLEPAEVLLYHGCYVYLQADQCIKLEKMLDATGVNYTTVGKLEYCCGCFAFYRGHDDSKTINPRLMEMVKKVNPKRIITNCGHCYNTMSDLVLNYEGDNPPEVRHAAEELLDLNIQRRLEFAHLGTTYTIHDSCNFRTLHSDHSPLRKILRRIGGIHEMLSHGTKGRCCGDVSKYYDPDHINRVNRKVKIREFVSSGADQMVTVCAGCYENFHTNPQLHTVDLIDILHEAFSVARAEDIEKEKKTVIQWENMSPVIEE
jgi:Fe-S oxidoreductase